MKTTFCSWGKPKTAVFNGPSSPLSQAGRAGNEQTAPSTPGSPPWPWFGMPNVQAEKPRAAAIQGGCNVRMQENQGKAGNTKETV